MYNSSYIDKCSPIEIKYNKLKYKGNGIIVEYEDWDVPTATKKNLEYISSNSSIVWKKVYAFLIDRSNPQQQEYYAWSTIFEGNDDKGVVYHFWRKETKSPGAGQTYIYIDGYMKGKASTFINLLEIKSNEYDISEVYNDLNSLLDRMSDSNVLDILIVIVREPKLWNGLVNVRDSVQRILFDRLPKMDGCVYISCYDIGHKIFSKINNINEDIQLTLVKSPNGLGCIKNPTEQTKQLHNMLYGI
jgi:hypothetical protein